MGAPARRPADGPDDVRCTVPQGSFRLERRHPVGRQPLRAWDAADVLLLQHVAREECLEPGATVVVVDDVHGAVTTALAASAVELGVRLVHRCDSFTARRAAQENLRRNGLDPLGVVWTSSLDEPPDRIDVLLLRIPRDTAAMDDQVRRLRRSMHPRTRVIAAAMVKHLHRPAVDALSTVVGAVRPSLAEHKARLLFAEVDEATAGAPEALSARWNAVDPAGGQAWPAVEVAGLPGVFSHDRLDPGTELLLRAWSAAGRQASWTSVVDLGCGTGVIAAVMAGVMPEAQVWAVDDSWRAVASTLQTFVLTHGSDERVRARVADALEESADGDLPADRTVDAVFVNPPFHDANAITDAIARRMFRSARRAVRPGGEIWVVGNRHLGYHISLGRVFGRPTVVASDPRFVVLRAVAR